MIIGASTGAHYPHYLTEDSIERLARAGFAVAEVMLQTRGEYDAAYIRRLHARARDAGIRVHSLHVYTSLHPLFDPYPRRREEGFAAFHQAIMAAEVLEANCLVWHGPTRRDRQDGVTNERFRAVLAEVASAAQAAGVLLTLENVSWCVVSDAAAVRMVRDWDLPVGFTFDPFQAAEAEADAAALIEAMGSQLANVHLSDHGVDGSRHLPVGEGTIDWSRVLGHLAEAGYRGPLILEGNCEGDPARLAQGRARVAALLASLRRE